MRIAYLEDEVETAACVASWLRDAGYQVEIFHSGEACARAVIGDRFDAVLLDWMVPDLPGTEVLARLLSQVKAGDALLVKASHGMALETILEGFYKQFQNTTGVSG